MARGGRRTPRNPAPVSGPGALSERTDGGPGQPIREMPAENYGDRTANVNLQQAAPMADTNDAPASPAAQQPPPMPLNGVLGPTARPNENPLIGLPEPATVQPRYFRNDPQMFLRQLYLKYPDPAIARLIDTDPGSAP